MALNQEICEACLSLRKCSKAQIEMTGSTEAKVVLLLPHPEREDQDGNSFDGPNAKMIMSTIPDKYQNDFAIVYAVKCPSYKNGIDRKFYAEPDKKVIANCKKHLYEELKQFTNNPVILSFGSLALKIITNDDEIRITKEMGIARSVKFKDLEFTVIPNYDPGAIRRSQNKDIGMMRMYTLKAFEHGTVENNVDLTDKFEIVNPQRGMEIIDSIIENYKAGKIKHVIFDTETSVDMEPIKGGEIIMVQVTHDLMDKAYSIPLYVTNEIHHKDYPYDVPVVEFEVSEVERIKLRNKIKEMLELVPISGQNLKYDLKWCMARGFCDLNKVKIYMDTLNVSVQMQGTGGGIDNSLKSLSRRYFHVAEDWDIEIDEYLGRFKLNKDKHFGMIPTGVLGRYAALDVWYNKLLVNKFLEIVPQSLLDAAGMVTDVCFPLVSAEVKGIQMSKTMLNYLDNSYDAYLTKKREQSEELQMVKKLIGKYIGPFEEKNKRKKKPLDYKELKKAAFNFNNSAKVGELVYGKDFYGLPINPDMVGKAGPSTDKDARAWLLSEVLTENNINGMADDPELAPKQNIWKEGKQFLNMFSNYKRIGKLLNDYVRTFPHSMNEHLVYMPSFNPNGTITGRFSSPFHSMPSGTMDIKRTVVSRWANSGGLILAADQSQIELRVVAAVSGEQALIDGFIAGVDAHTGTACALYGLPPEKITKAQRAVGKTVNFAVLYGKTVYNLAESLGIPVSEAAKIMNNFYSRVPDLSAWKLRVEKETQESGYVETLFGRRIHIPSAFSDRKSDIEETKRLAVNYRIQSAASDIVLNSVTDMYTAATNEGLNSTFLATVHDSTEYDVYPGELFQMVNIYKEHGEYNIQKKYPWMICPLHLDIELGTSWGGAIKCNITEHDDRKLVFTTSGSKKDIFSVINDARKAYNVDYKITKESKPEEEKEDVFFKGGPELDVEFCITAK